MSAFYGVVCAYARGFVVRVSERTTVRVGKTNQNRFHLHQPQTKSFPSLTYTRPWYQYPSLSEF